jgi:phosphotriesterase-related protein
MLGDEYLDKSALCKQAVTHLTEAKQKFGLSTIVDCTPVNIGRDLDLIKRVSRGSGVHIVAASGFYHTEEAMLFDIPEEQILQNVLADICKNNVGVIKFAVESEKMTKLSKKLISALCTVQKETELPLIIHTNAKNKNGREILSTVLEAEVFPSAVTIGHLSDTDDMDYVTELLQHGCYVGFDRIYKSSRPEYYIQKARDIYTLCERGFSDRILLSQDALVFNGFRADAHLREDNPYAYIFERLLPALSEIGLTDKEIHSMMTENPKRMFLCQ